MIGYWYFVPFDDKLFKIIESEIAKEQIVKTNQIKEIIEEGTKIKKDLSYEPIVYFKEGILKLIKWYTDLRN